MSDDINAKTKEYAGICETCKRHTYKGLARSYLYCSGCDFPEHHCTCKPLGEKQ